MTNLHNAYHEATTREERDEVFAQILHTPQVVAMVRRQTRRFESKGLFDAQSIIYLWLWERLEAGQDILDEGTLTNHLKSHLGTLGAASVPSWQHKRYRGISKRVSEGASLKDELAGTMSLAEYHAIYRVDASSAVALETVSKAPDLAAEEEAEVRYVLDLVAELDEETQDIIGYRYWLDELENLSWERVAEEMNDASEVPLWDRRTVAQRHHEGIHHIREELGIA